jgi:hypothetical protein
MELIKAEFAFKAHLLPNCPKNSFCYCGGLGFSGHGLQCCAAYRSNEVALRQFSSELPQAANAFVHVLYPGLETE